MVINAIQQLGDVGAMKKPRSFLILRHAALMVFRTIKSYALLSVTILLSFSLLLGYLFFTDTSIYNQYRDIFLYRRGDVLIRDTSGDSNKVGALSGKLDTLDDTSYYVYYFSLGGNLETNYTIDDPNYPQGNTMLLDNWQLYYLPDYAWIDGTLTSFDSDIVWVGEPREEFSLDCDEVVLCEGIYYALGFDHMEAPVYTFRFDSGITLTLRIVGYILDQYPMDITSAGADGNSYTVSDYYANRMILSAKLIESSSLLADELQAFERYIVVHSNRPEEVVQLAKTIGFSHIESVYAQQNEALEAIRYEKKNKAIISIALLILLGINLYSSFTNALNERKFEIGVKRAIGASGWSIVRQFLYESFIVMAINILLSVVLVVDLLIVYKYIFEHTPDEWGNYNEYILYISTYSIGMFMICTLSLTVVFSLIFAYKSAKVEIVQYLKAE